MLDVSLYEDSDMVAVELWGPFVSMSELAPIAEQNRYAIKSIPPQLYDDEGTKALEFMVEE